MSKFFPTWCRLVAHGSPEPLTIRLRLTEYHSWGTDSIWTAKPLGGRNRSGQSKYISHSHGDKCTIFEFLLPVYTQKQWERFPTFRGDIRTPSSEQKCHLPHKKHYVRNQKNSSHALRKYSRELSDSPSRLWSYPLVKKSIALAARSGVLSSPGRSGFSPREDSNKR